MEIIRKFVYKIIKCYPFLDVRISYIKDLSLYGKILDIGCGKGDVLKIFHQVRPDIKIYGIDVKDFADFLPKYVEFEQLNVEFNQLPFPSDFFDGVSIIHVIEHIEKLQMILKEILRVLKIGGKFYLETPHIKSLFIPSLNFFSDNEGGPINFYDDITHKRIYTKSDLKNYFKYLPVRDIRFGIYRNYVYSLISPFLLLLGLLFLKRRWVVVGVHHLFGWSMYCTGKKG